MTVKQCETLISKYRNRIAEYASSMPLITDPQYNNWMRSTQQANKLLQEYQARLRKLTT